MRAVALRSAWVECASRVLAAFRAISVRRAGEKQALESSEYRPSYEEGFRNELRAFHAAATGEAGVQTTVEQARRDVELLISAFRKAVA